MFAKYLLSGLLLLISGVVWSQCPYGMPNNPGCVPPDAWPQNQGGAVSVRQPYWVYTWGALATDEKVLGASSALDSKRQAEKAALKDCRNKGGRGCRVVLAYHHQCASVASGDNRGVAWAHGPDIEEAKKDALDVCNGLDGHGECYIYYSNCTEPYLVR